MVLLCERRRKCLQGLRTMFDVEVFGELDDEDLTIKAINLGGAQRVEQSRMVLRSFHTHPDAAYGDKAFGWPGKTDLLNMCIASLRGTVVHHIVVAREGLYCMTSLTSSTKGHDVRFYGDILRAFDIENQTSPHEYLRFVHASELPIEISFVNSEFRGDTHIS